MEAIRLDRNSAVIDGISNKIRTTFKLAHGFKSHEYRDKIIYLVGGGLSLNTIK
jgi:hypothetical protein